MNKVLPLIFAIVLVFSQGCSKVSGISPYKDNNLSFKVGDKTYFAKVISITVNNQFIVVRHTEKESPRTNSTFGFCRPESQTQKNQKSYFLANARKETTE